MSPDASFPMVAQCACGAATISISGRPLMRAICHCLTCQEYTGEAFADVTVFDARDVHLENEDSVSFRHYQKPAMAKRGRCVKCARAVIEEVPLPLLPNLKMVSTENLDAALRIEPGQHIFYHRRKADADDSLPKRSGLASSQLHFMGSLLAAMWRRRSA